VISMSRVVTGDDTVTVTSFSGRGVEPGVSKSTVTGREASMAEPFTVDVDVDDDFDEDFDFDGLLDEGFFEGAAVDLVAAHPALAPNTTNATLNATTRAIGRAEFTEFMTAPGSDHRLGRR
jgi:hypothetical protein